MDKEDLQVDCLVVGGGAAGLSAALRAAQSVKVAVTTKRGLSDSTTSEAQGGIAVSLGEDDDVLLHAQDTLAAGAGLCEEEAVEILVREGVDRVRDLLAAGAGFDRLEGELAFSREAAHSRRRVVRAGGDATGREVQRVLAQKAVHHPAIRILEHVAARRLLLEDGVCRGVVATDLRTGDPVILTARAVILATGGAGQLYARTTNPNVATGDGIALALQGGAELMDMEFVQFHPTVLFLAGAPPFLISEAVRGEGAVLRNSQMEPFMEKYHPGRELAPRDVVSRSIMTEMRATNTDHVWLDLTEIKGIDVSRRFPTIAENCLSVGINIACEPVPVAPAAHYLMGGIRTDLWGRTGLDGLLACGECACVGLHGANRLASNSILEGLVFGYRAGQAAAEGGAGGGPAGARPAKEVLPSQVNELPDSQISEAVALRNELQRLMWGNVSLARCRESLEEAEEALAEIASRGALLGESWQGTELANMAAVSKVVTRCALIREESRGGHFRTDFPLQDDLHWAKHSVARLSPWASDELEILFFPVGGGVLRGRKAVTAQGLGAKCQPVIQGGKRE